MLLYCLLQVNSLLRSLHNRRKFKIIVSGSNSSLLSREIATELRGRYTDEIMFPFSFMEFLEGAFFILKSEKFSYSVRVRTMNPCKIYLIDTGVALISRLPFFGEQGKAS